MLDFLGFAWLRRKLPAAPVEDAATTAQYGALVAEAARFKLDPETIKKLLDFAGVIFAILLRAWLYQAQKAQWEVEDREDPKTLYVPHGTYVP